MIWTDDKIEQLKRLWTQGFSASQIAAKLDTDSRNSIIGKMHRLGLPSRVRPVADPNRVRVRKPRSKPGNRPKHPWQVMPPLPTKPSSELPAQSVDPSPDIPMEQRCTILQLGDSKCRWPVGDPRDKEFFFCGGVPYPGYPYCACHCGRAFARKAA